MILKYVYIKPHIFYLFRRITGDAVPLHQRGGQRVYFALSATERLPDSLPNRFWIISKFETLPLLNNDEVREESNIAYILHKNKPFKLYV